LKTNQNFFNLIYFREKKYYFYDLFENLRERERERERERGDMLKSKINQIMNA
jgi:hypothetical protein